MATKTARRKASDGVTAVAEDAKAAANSLGEDMHDDIDEKEKSSGNGGSISDGDSDPNNDDSSSDDIDVDAETANRLMAIEQELQSTLSYDKYLEYIALLRTAPGLRKRLRDAYEAMATRFPLSEELWLAWVNDELAAVSGPDDVAWLLELLHRAATRDYLAPAIWELYLDVTYNLDPGVRDLEPEGIDRYRAMCEEAVATAGLHLASGHRLWEKYRIFELAVESKLTEWSGGSGAAPSAAASKQQDRVRALYHRQLQVPLQDVSQTLEEYKAWEAGHGKAVPAHVAKAAEKALEAAELRTGFESGVAAEAPADVTKLGAFMSYIKMEQNAGDSSRVQVLYERAVTAFPLTHSLWLQYGQYMETHTKLSGPINHVYSRAARNCPWIATVWERAIRALDRTAAAPEAVDEMYENALKAGLQTADDYLAVMLARLDYLRRRAAEAIAASVVAKNAVATSFAKLRDAFRTASEFMMSHYPDHVDRSLSLPGYWAHCEVHVMSDMAAAREVWEGALKGGLGRFAEAWEGYIGLERSTRHFKEARALFRRCYNRRLEGFVQLRLCHAWLRFEREEGSADDYIQALLRVEPILEESAAAAAAAADEATAAAAKAAVQKAKNLTKDELKAMRQAKDPHFKNVAKVDNASQGDKAAKRDRREDSQNPAEIMTEDPISAKRLRRHEPEPTVMHSGTAVVAQQQDGVAAAVPPDADGDAEMADQQASTPGHEMQDADADTRDAANDQHTATALTSAEGRTHYTDNLTVFVKGLRFKIKGGELDAFLKSHVSDGLKEIRLIRDPETGQSRGFAYVECSSREALQKTVALNGTSFQGKTLFIAESNPPGHTAGGRGRFGGRFGGPPGGHGFAGRGRGRSWGGNDGSGDTSNKDAEMADVDASVSSGRGGGRGHGGGRGGLRPALGHPSGRGSMRTHLHISQGSAPPTALVPRSVQLCKAGDAEAAAFTGDTGAGNAAVSNQQLSNDDFRKMLLKGTK